ncbi:zinc ribbon domain-containing protein [Bacteroidota bacterium]
MATKKVKKTDTTDLTVEDKLKALFELQKVDSEVDKIRVLRGELPLEVQDLEDELAGLETRISNYNNEIIDLESSISKRKNEIKDSETLIKKYESQQDNVRNNREFDSLSKEIEFQSLEIQLSEKKIKESMSLLADKQSLASDAKIIFEERQSDLNIKKSELDEIILDTKKEEDDLSGKSNEVLDRIEERLSSAYKRIRKNARNGLAVVTVQRNACGGCFNKIPPQRQLDIASRKKIIVCEYCGRILVDENIDDTED